MLTALAAIIFPGLILVAIVIVAPLGPKARLFVFFVISLILDWRRRVVVGRLIAVVHVLGKLVNVIARCVVVLVGSRLVPILDRACGILFPEG